jgi:hypothetical protein
MYDRERTFAERRVLERIQMTVTQLLENGFILRLADIISTCAIVAVECVGFGQWIKNFIGCGKIRCAVTALLFCGLASVVLVLVDGKFSMMFHIVFLSLAMGQLGYQAILKGLPNLLNTMIDKAAKAQGGAE